MVEPARHHIISGSSSSGSSSDSSSSLALSSQRGFVALQDQPMESSLSRCRRRGTATSYTDMPAMPTDLTYGRKPPLVAHLQPTVQQSNSWPSRNSAAHLAPVNRVPMGVSRPPFPNMPDKPLLPCRYMKERQDVSMPLHHIPSAEHGSQGLMSPMWGTGGAQYFNPGYQEGPAHQMMQHDATTQQHPPRYDILQDAMRQTIHNGNLGSGAVGYPNGPHHLMGQSLPPLQHTVPMRMPYQPSGSWTQQNKHMQHGQQVTVPDYSNSNISANDSFDAGASDGEYDDGGGDETRIDLPPTENPEDLVIEIDLSHKPETLQEAIAMYIDFLVLENDKKTHISECQLLPVRFDFEKEQYYMEIMSKPTPFPTEKFRGWLKLYNVDIEITDPQGNTASQTTFAPSAQCGGNASAGNTVTRQPQPLPAAPQQPPPMPQTMTPPVAPQLTALQNAMKWQMMNQDVTMRRDEMHQLATENVHQPNNMTSSDTPHANMVSSLMGMQTDTVNTNVRVNVGVQCNEERERAVEMPELTPDIPIPNYQDHTMMPAFQQNDAVEQSHIGVNNMQGNLNNSMYHPPVCNMNANAEDVHATPASIRACDMHPNMTNQHVSSSSNTITSGSGIPAAGTDNMLAANMHVIDMTANSRASNTADGYLHNANAEYPEAAANAIFAAVCGLGNSSVVEPHGPAPVEQYHQLTDLSDVNRTDSESANRDSVSCTERGQASKVICIAPISDSTMSEEDHHAEKGDGGDDNKKRENLLETTTVLAKRTRLAQSSAGESSSS